MAVSVVYTFLRICMQGKQLSLYVTKAIQGKQLKHKHQILRNIDQIGQFKLYLAQLY